MATDKREEKVTAKRESTWRGQEVRREPGGDAERAAERAESRRAAPTSADEQVAGHRRRARRASREAPDEKIEEAGEAHQQREAEGQRPPHGKL